MRIGFNKCLSVFVLIVVSIATCQSATGAEKLSGSMGWSGHVVNLLVHPFNGLLGFIFIVFLSSLACGFLLLAIYRLINRNGDPSVRSLFAREAFIKLRWPLWLLIVTAVFVISNQFLVRGRAVGIWDTNGAYYPYQVLVADHAREGRLLQWDPWSNGGIPEGGDPQFGAFSPVNVIIGLITRGTSTGFIFYWLFMW